MNPISSREKILGYLTLTNEEGKAAGFNFSAILSDGIKAKLGIK